MNADLNSFISIKRIIITYDLFCCGVLNEDALPNDETPPLPNADPLPKGDVVFPLKPDPNGDCCCEGPKPEDCWANWPNELPLLANLKFKSNLLKLLDKLRRKASATR